MISNRTSRYAQMLKSEGNRLPVIKVIVAFLNILYEIEDRKKTNDDPDKFLSLLGFRELDRKQILNKNSAVYMGQGQFNNDDAPTIFRLMGLSVESVKTFQDYNIICEVFSSPIKGSTDEIIDRLIYFSKEGKEILRLMLKIGSTDQTISYYEYFDMR